MLMRAVLRAPLGLGRARQWLSVLFEVSDSPICNLSYVQTQGDGDLDVSERENEFEAGRCANHSPPLLSNSQDDGMSMQLFFVVVIRINGNNAADLRKGV